MKFRKFRRLFDNSVNNEWEHFKRRISLIEDTLSRVYMWLRILENNTDAEELMIALRELYDYLDRFNGDLNGLESVLDKIKEGVYDFIEATENEMGALGGLLNEDNEPPSDNTDE